MNVDFRKYLDVEVISQLGGLEIIAREIVEGFIAGLHRSPHYGFNVEFSEHRQYHPGDEIRYIDWRIYGKSDKYFIKQFEADTNLKAYILLDVSKSMGFKHNSKSLSKFEYSVYLSASLGYLILKQRDAVGLVLFSNGILSYIPAKSNPAHIKTIINEIEKFKPSKTTDISSTFHELAERLKRRCFIIIISDLFDNFESILSGLQHFRHKNHEILLFHILDNAELEFPYEQQILFIDIEDGSQIITNADVIKEGYKKQIDKFIKDFKLSCGQIKIDYNLINTKTTYDSALRTYLIKRSSR